MTCNYDLTKCKGSLAGSFPHEGDPICTPVEIHQDCARCLVYTLADDLISIKDISLFNRDGTFTKCV